MSILLNTLISTRRAADRCAGDDSWHYHMQAAVLCETVINRIALTLPDQGLIATNPRLNHTYYLTPSLQPDYAWRITVFDSLGPLSHSEYRSHKDAIGAMIRDYNPDLHSICARAS